MSSEYSNDVKCVELEPIYFAQDSRVEWRLHPNKLYTNSLTLMNLGITKASGGRLNKLVGCYGTVSRIYLQDGNQELEVLTRANEWLGIKSHLHSNQYNEELAMDFSGNQKSNRIDIRDITTAQDTTLGAMGKKIIQGGVRPQLGTIDATKENTFKGQMDLSECFSLLQSVPYLDTTIFKDLKVIIEFDMKETNVVASIQDGTARHQLRPYLVVEEVVAQDILEASLGKKPQAIPYTPIESDVFMVPALAPKTTDLNPVQDLTFHVSSYNNKKVARMLVATRTMTSTNNQDGTGSDVVYGNYNSHGMLLQKNQVRVNGRSVLPRNGIERDNQRLAMMADVWSSTASIAPFQNGLAFVATDANARSNYMLEGNASVGTCDYFGINLASVLIEDLQLDYTRTGIWNGTQGQTDLSKYNSALELHVFAEVRKAIVFGQNGGYNIVYL